MMQKVLCKQSVQRVLRKSNIYRHASFKDLKENKDHASFSYDLDATMRDGHHDMKTFGLGFLRSVSSVAHQSHTMASLRGPYAVLENALDTIDQNTRAAVFWKNFSKDLRKADALALDVKSLGGNDLPTPASARYVAAIQNASEEMYQGDPASKGDLLLGHAYVRYLADLFGGSMLGNPTRLALALNKQPEFYNFPPNVTRNKIVYIDSFYKALNDAGIQMDDVRKKQVVDEAIKAFGHNAEIYKERPYLIPGAIRGGVNVAVGMLRERLHI